MKSRIAALLVACLVLTFVVGCQKTVVRGPEGKELAMTLPMWGVTAYRGQSTPVEIKIDRTNFTDKVTVSMSQLPNGVDVSPATQTVETDAATFILKTSPTANLVTKQAVTVTIAGPNGMQATDYFHLTVKE